MANDDAMRQGDGDVEDVARAMSRRLETAWNAGAGAGFAAPFAADADFVNVRGEHHRGRAAVEAGHRMLFESIYRGSTVQYTVTGARAIAEGVILMHSTARLRVPGGPLAGEHPAQQSLVLVRGGDGWRIASFHNTLIAPSPPARETAPAPGAKGMRFRRYIAAPRAAVYRALLDPSAIARWKVPDGMTAEVHQFDAREGGAIRVSLTYDDPSGKGKTALRTDTYHGRFEKLVPNEMVVEVDEFETADPSMQGEMTTTITLADAYEGTDFFAVHDGLPPGVNRADNAKGWGMAVERLAALVEAEQQRS